MVIKFDPNLQIAAQLKLNKKNSSVILVFALDSEHVA